MQVISGGIYWDRGFRIEHISRVKSRLWSFRSLAGLWLSPGEISGFWLGLDLGLDGGALNADAFGSTDSQSKRQELLIESLEVLKLITEVIRYFRHSCSCLQFFSKKPSR
jgi:hypothetical protein